MSLLQTKPMPLPEAQAALPGTLPNFRALSFTETAALRSRLYCAARPGLPVEQHA